MALQRESFSDEHLVYNDCRPPFLQADEAVRDHICDILSAESDQFSPKPRILVCAPSNAAIDELLERILRESFRDGNGRPYKPDMVRVGHEEALSDSVRQVRPRSTPSSTGLLNPFFEISGI